MAIPFIRVQGQGTVAQETAFTYVGRGDGAVHTVDCGNGSCYEERLLDDRAYDIEVIKLTATPANGWRFDRFESVLTVNGNEQQMQICQVSPAVTVDGGRTPVCFGHNNVTEVYGYEGLGYTQVVTAVVAVFVKIGAVPLLVSANGRLVSANGQLVNGR